ncbi:MAG: hypothetical protein L3J28_09135 [Candidatus Polarisedimenticolaceae bacterium]|nr:hypothetical protein [Candidatus Polarisedimenticolaceae bacterium]
MPDDSEPLELNNEFKQAEIPLLSDVVLPYIELGEEDITQPISSFISELAAIEEDDLALQSVAEDRAALAEIGAEDSYDYSDDEDEEVAAGPVRLSVPQHDVVVKAIRGVLHQKLSKEMSDLIAPVLEQTIEQITEVIHNELSQTLETRISTLIQQELDKQFGKE